MVEKILEEEEKGIIYKQQLEQIKSYLSSESPDSDMALLHIRLFIEQIPEETELEKEFEKLANPLREWYEKQMNILKQQVESGRYLESADAINKGIPLVKYQYATKLYFVLGILYERFKLYEERAIIEYEL